MGNQSTIEINGKQYDARTGKLLQGAQQLSKFMPKSPVSRSMDVAGTKPKHTSDVHKTVERSKTLMRHAVKKPAMPAAAKPIRTSVVSDISAPAPKRSANKPIRFKSDTEREARANNIKRSDLVSRFSDFAAPSSASVSPKHTVRPEAPVQTVPLRVSPAPVKASAHHASQHKTPGHAKSESVIQQGLRSAQSHQQPAHKIHHKRGRGKRSRFASFAASGMAVLLLGAFFTYQNIPQLSMRYAATRSGVQAQLPGYRPSGFALNNHIEYNPGQITVSFKSNTDDRNFTITQRSSVWNSEALRANYVADASDQIQTYEDKGRTIYLYGDSNATWVNGGVWYDINGNSQLNSDQLVRIATSM